MLVISAIALYVISSFHSCLAWNEGRAIEVLSDLLFDPNCPGIVVATASSYDKGQNGSQNWEEEMMEHFIQQYPQPITVLKAPEDKVENVNFLKASRNTDLVRQDAVIFAYNLGRKKLFELIITISK